MKLVKDYIDGRTVYYWVSDSEKAEMTSPQFRSLTQAEEWWKEQQFSRIQSPSRQRDNRISERKYLDENSSTAQSDSPSELKKMAVRVEIDLHKKKAR